jgi:hypothetical protein
MLEWPGETVRKSYKKSLKTLKYVPRRPIFAGREVPEQERSTMEISPVSGVRIAPMVKSRESFLGTPGVFEVVYSSRTDDETYSPSNQRAASGAEEEEDEEAEDGESEPRVQAIEGGAKKQINYFA